jgi:hypothetical protein
MTEQQLILKALPLITIILAVMLFVVFKIAARFKSKAAVQIDSNRLSISRAADNPNTPADERIKLERPALIQKAQGYVKVTIKDLSFNGAFITCPVPFAIGTKFQVKIFFQGPIPEEFKAEVLWNNKNVPADEVIHRGMMVCFLNLTSDERKRLQDRLKEQNRSLTA